MSTLKKISSSLFCFVVAAVYIYGSVLIEDFEASGEVFMSPRHFPIAFSGLLIVLGLLNMCRELKKNDAAASGRKPQMLLISVCVLLLCSLLLKTLGSIICGAVFLGSHFILLAQEPPTRKKQLLMIIWAVIAAIAFSYLFRYGFGIRLTLFPAF